MSARLDAQALLTLWERAVHDHPVDRALSMLAALSRLPVRDLARLDIGRRDALLLQCRAGLFGEDIAGFAHCPQCSCAVEVSITPPDDADPALSAGEHNSWFALPGPGGIECRLPTSLDLAAIAGCDEVEVARHLLRTRCIRSADALDETAYAAAEAEIAERAGVAALTVDLDCPSCGHAWSLDLDIAAFLWDELKAVAARLLREVDVLARRYGWSEREILGLSEARRYQYPGARGVSAGYFHLLAARTLGTAQRLGPVLPARFEPVQDWTSPGDPAEERLVPAARSPQAAPDPLGEATGPDETAARAGPEGPRLPEDEACAAIRCAQANPGNAHTAAPGARRHGNIVASGKSRIAPGNARTYPRSPRSCRARS